MLFAQQVMARSSCGPRRQAAATGCRGVANIASLGVLLAVATLGGCLAAAAKVDTNDLNTSGNCCQTVLLSGIYQMINLVTPSSATFSQVHQAACLDYSLYSYR